MVAISFLSLVKFSLFLTAGPIVLLIALDECLRRRWPRYLAAFAAGSYSCTHPWLRRLIPLMYPRSCHRDAIAAFLF